MDQDRPASRPSFVTGEKQTVRYCDLLSAICPVCGPAQPPGVYPQHDDARRQDLQMRRLKCEDI